MTDDLFAAKVERKQKRERIKKGTRVAVCASDGADPHGAEIGALGTAVAKVKANPDLDDMWRGEGSVYYIVELDSPIMEGAQAGKHEVCFWPEEIERVD